ncbi:MAG: FKBP-type peptidyl-prolyl cis-trans isomerase [Ferruginibacter sp.]
MMKYFFSIAAISLALVIISCSKDSGCPYSEPVKVASAGEIDYLQNYVTTNAISATQHSSGIFYTILQNGSNAAPNICSVITAKYKGSLLSNGAVFDSTASNSVLKIELGRLIEGWQRGLPLIRETGKITLYIPPSLGYGAQIAYDNNGNVLIPANSYLKFEIELVDTE